MSPALPTIARRAAAATAAAAVVLVSLSACTPEQDRNEALAEFRNVGANDATLQVVDCIMYRESRYRDDAVHYNANGTVDRGLFQINSVHAGDWDRVIGQPYDQTWGNPLLNAHYAADLYRRYGLQPWGGTCHR